MNYPQGFPLPAGRQILDMTELTSGSKMPVSAHARSGKQGRERQKKVSFVGCGRTGAAWSGVAGRDDLEAAPSALPKRPADQRASHRSSREHHESTIESPRGQPLELTTSVLDPPGTAQESTTTQLNVPGATLAPCTVWQQITTQLSGYRLRRTGDGQRNEEYPGLERGM